MLLMSGTRNGTAKISIVTTAAEALWRMLHKQNRCGRGWELQVVLKVDSFGLCDLTGV